MIEVPLANVPNQSLSINLDGSQYDINVQATNGDAILGTLVMAFDIIRNGVAIVTGARSTPGSFLIPAAYLEDGNFILITMNDEYPDWQQFGVTQTFVFISQAELEAIRASTGS